MPATHNSVFYRPDALPAANQQRQSTEGINAQKSRKNRCGVFKLGGRVRHAIYETLQGQKVKVTRSRNYQQTECYNSAVDGHINFKLGENYRRRGRHM